ncbi:GNAT family N-acetyltransferase [Nocardioides alkalitolerans]|uniref:GNAT family N-acetyltransferase n=1 Tax=Nocardioides alkalitolerans TaxID=281714 RepID=UPI0003F55A09|nr:GNAT family N-acetyltransferase [Nocardioides alkalitolerans]
MSTPSPGQAPAQDPAVLPLPPDVTLRRATPADAEAGAALHRDCWAEAYPGLIPQDALEAVLANHERRVRMWEQMAASERPPVLAVHAAPEGERLVGFAMSGPGDPDAADDDLPALYLHAIYVRRGWWGTGVGDALLVAEVADTDCTLVVLAANGRARGFYERHGFVAHGDPVPDPHLGVDDLRMVRRGATARG